MDNEKKGMGAAVAKGKELSDKIMDIPIPVGGTLHDVKEISKDAVKKTAEMSKEMAVKTAEKSMDVAIKTKEMSKEIAHDTAEMGVEVAKKTAEKGAEVVKKTAEKGKDAAKKTVEKSREVIVESKKKMDKKIEADRAKDKWEYILILVNFFGPFLAVIGVFVIFFVALPNRTASRFVISSALSFVPLVGDKTVLISNAPHYSGHGVYIMAVTIAIMDSLLSWFIVYNIELVKKWGKIGPMIIKVEKQSQGLLNKYDWMRKVAIIFIVIFVMIPFQGSGGLAASIIGRLMGLKPWKVLLSVAIGSLLGCLGIAYMVDTIKKYISQPVQITIFVVFVALITLFFISSHRKNKRAKADDNPP